MGKKLGMGALLISTGVAILSSNALAGPDLRSVLEQRIKNDRSGACVLAARVTDTVEWARACAGKERDLDRTSRFEIGSVSKAMQGIVVAALAEEGVLDIGEPLVDLLPEGSKVPRQGDEPIRIRHLLTHDSGLPRLPAGMPMSKPHDPYADLDEETLLGLLADTKLSRAPGEQFEYSNFGAMLLSLAISHRSGRDFDELLEEIIFSPLSMDDAGLGGAVVQGHDVMGNPVVPWSFHTNLAGVGGVRASLDDLIRFVQANLHEPDTDIGEAIARSHEVLAAPSGQSMGWGWLHLEINDRSVLFHNGGTAGMSTELVMDMDQGMGVVVLADTGLAMRGGLTDLALHLLDPGVDLKAPQQVQERAASVDAQPLSDFEGEYALHDGDEPFMGMVLRIFEQEGNLSLQAYTPQNEQPALDLDHAGTDHFVREDIDVAIRFLRGDDGKVKGLAFSQAGLELEGRRR